VGFGRTEKPDADYGYRYFARFLHSFFSVMGIKKASLIGHSLGGGIALQFTVYYPEMVKDLILVASGGLSREFSLSLRILTLPVIGEILFAFSLKKPEALIGGLFYHHTPVPEEWVRTFSGIYKDPSARRAFLQTLRNNATLFNGTKASISDIVPFLHNINARTLVVWGKQDRVIPFHISKIPLQYIPHSGLWAIDDCGHAPHLDYPREFNKRVKEFLLDKGS
jgi:4,5:9,10-diseco-3-hydroxy-5,9,17-trioxoandrosta-1(10),2-diene-4-oate hydrolase